MLNSIHKSGVKQKEGLFGENMSAGGGAPTGAPMIVQNGGIDDVLNSEQQNAEQNQNGGRVFEKFFYKQCDSGPYKVVVQKTIDENQVGNEVRLNGINKITVGILLKQNGFAKSVMDIKKIGRAKVLVFFSEWKEANRLVTCQNLSLKRFKAFIPKSFVTVKGVIAGIPEELEAEEILTDIETNKEVMEVFRMQRTVAPGKRVPIKKLGVVFRSNKLPEYVRVYSVITKVEPYVTKAVMCNACLRYGHIALNCKSRKRCGNCGETHEEQVNDQECPNQTRCVHCKDSHKSSDVKCPERKKQNDIKKLMASKNLTYQEARDEFRVVVSNGFTILEKADEFPSIYESFTNVLKKSTNQEVSASKYQSAPRANNRNVTVEQKGKNLGAVKKQIRPKDKKPENKYKEREIDEDGFETVRYSNKKRKTDAEHREEQEVTKPETQVMTVEKHLELRKRWEDKMKEIARQKDELQSTVGRTFNQLSQAIATKDENGYYVVMEVVKQLAMSLGYEVEDGIPKDISENGDVQDITE